MHTQHVGASGAMDVGFIGLGRMGSAMARNLAKAGHRVRAWNRSPASIQDVAAVPTSQDAFQADVVFTMLSDDQVIRSVLLDPDVLQSARHDVVHVVTSTISVAFADELRGRHTAAGIGYVSAPVFGRPDIAESAQLSIMAAGKTDAVERVRPLLDLIGRRVWVLGTDPKQANAAKIAGNTMIAMAIEAMAEGVVLAKAAGLPAEVFLDLMLQAQFGGSRAYENYSAKIRNADFEAGFLMRLGLKDLRLATEAAHSAGKPLPMLDAVHGRMAEAVAAGMGERDWSGIADYTLRH